MRHTRYVILAPVVAAGVLLSFPAIGVAQLSDEELRRERIETIEQLKHTEDIFGSTTRASANMLDRYGWIMDYGGAVSLSYTGGSNNDRATELLDSTDHNYDYEMNLFGSIQDKARQSKFYVRLKTKYIETKKSGTAGTVRGNDYEQANFDLVYFEKKIPTQHFQHQWTIGRQFISVGRGIAYGAVGNGVAYSVRIPKGFFASYNLFMVRQNARDDNADVFNGTSDFRAGRTKRQFLGMELKLRFAPRHTMTAYWVVNDDQNTESSPLTGRHQYDSNYFGYGMDGPFPFAPDLTYFGEYIKVTGRSFGRRVVDELTPRNVVDAFAFDMGLRYKFPKNRFTPTLNVQFSAASGDADRIGSAVGSTAVGLIGTGNRVGTDDNAFTSFGGLSLGYALAPTFSNIRVLQFGGSVKPWKDIRMLSSATLNLAYFKYWTDISSGAMSDVSFAVADPPKDDLGGELNASIKWKILSDLKCDLRLGHFRPGEMYDGARSPEDYIKYKITVDL